MRELIVVFLFGEKFQKLRFCAAFILYFLILLLGSIPNARAEIGQLAPGPVLHSVAYAVITFLLFTGSRGERRRRFLQAFLIIAVMGMLDEYLQSFFPYRTAAVADWLVDCCASFVTLCLLLMLSPLRAVRAVPNDRK
jgi:VanZ family protein